jgi:predicted metalloendopeptidase
MSSSSLGTNFLYSQNQLFVPAAILQSPFLNTSLPPSVTYGALGFLYGFGMEHAFDKKGGKFDINGVQRLWWDKKTKKAFKKKRECLGKIFERIKEY